MKGFLYAAVEMRSENRRKKIKYKHLIFAEFFNSKQWLASYSGGSENESPGGERGRRRLILLPTNTFATIPLKFF